VLGLEQTTAGVVRRFEGDVVGFRRRVPAERPAGPAYKGHDCRGSRGDDRPNVNEQDLRVLAGSGKPITSLAVDLGGFPAPGRQRRPGGYDAWLESALKQPRQLLPVCEELDQGLVDLHTRPADATTPTSASSSTRPLPGCV